MALDVSHEGRHLVTAGDKVVKVWDYHMRLDLNFQVSLLLITALLAEKYWTVLRHCNFINY